jgi:hypothetical protein
MARWDPPAILAYVGDTANAVTHITTAPPLLQMLVDDPGFADTDFSTMRKMAIGGGACTPELLRTFAAKGIELHPQYGGTETGPAALVLEDGLDRAMTGTCGKPVMHTRVRLVHPETRRLLPRQRPVQGHVQVRRGERLRGRGGEHPRRPAGRGRGGDHRGARPEVGRGRARGGGARRRRGRHARRASGGLRGTAGPVQTPAPTGDHRRARPQRHRQGPKPALVAQYAADA